jgi:uncharacterized damage-inducible protein DinB/predicted RNase H-like HicB family nuclease
MPLYRLYLESGPRRKKTMVHVLELLGCVANGPTTEEALDRTPAAIDDFRRFLRRHGDAARAAEDEVEIIIAEHVMEGTWLGNGDPSIVFAPDLDPLSAEELDMLIQRFEWMHRELCDLVGDLSPEQREEAPPKGRPIETILEHVLESEVNYLTAFGRLPGLPAPGSIVKKREGDLLDWIGRVRAIEGERLHALSPEERSEPFIHWKQTRTARKVMRRVLEHQWEHLVELRRRLELTV